MATLLGPSYCDGGTGRATRWSLDKSVPNTVKVHISWVLRERYLFLLFGVVLLVTAIQVCGIICSFRRTLKTLMFASVWIIDWYNAVALISHILPLCLLRVMYFNSTTAGFHNYQRCGILSDSTTRICLCHVLPRTGVLFYRRNCPLCQIFQDKEWGDARGRSVGQLSASQAPIRSLIFHKSSHTFRILYETMATPINI